MIDFLRNSYNFGMIDFLCNPLYLYVFNASFFKISGHSPACQISPCYKMNKMSCSRVMVEKGKWVEGEKVLLWKFPQDFLLLCHCWELSYRAISIWPYVVSRWEVVCLAKTWGCMGVKLLREYWTMGRGTIHGLLSGFVRALLLLCQVSSLCAPHPFLWRLFFLLSDDYPPPPILFWTITQNSGLKWLS